jgi:hypothetical protein
VSQVCERADEFAVRLAMLKVTGHNQVGSSFL